MNSDFEHTAEELVPIIEPAKWAIELAQYDISLPVHQRFVAGLFISYQLDFPEFQISLSPDSIQQFMGEFNPTIQRIHEVAIHNLRQRTSLPNFNFSDQGTIIYKAQDRFTASRILLPEFLNAWQNLITGKLLIAIPHRDVIFAFGDEDNDQVHEMQGRISSEFSEHAMGLYEGILTWEQGYLNVFSAP